MFFGLKVKVGVLKAIEKNIMPFFLEEFTVSQGRSLNSRPELTGTNEKNIHLLSHL
jgi:hypothetical protein